PGGGVGVEMVGGLVENGDVWARHEELRERDAPSLPSAALAAWTLDVADAQLVQEAERFVPPLPAAETVDRVVELGLLVDERLIVGARAEQRRDGLVTRARRCPGGERRFDDGARAGVRVELRLLREVPDREPSPHAHGPPVGLLGPREDLGERRLSRAVRADQPDLLPARQRERGIFEDDLGTEGLAEVLGSEGGQDREPPGAGAAGEPACILRRPTRREPGPVRAELGTARALRKD